MDNAQITDTAVPAAGSLTSTVVCIPLVTARGARISAFPGW